MSSVLNQKIVLISRVLVRCLALMGLFFIGCAGPQVVKETSVAVWDLENLSSMKSGYPDLSEHLSARVIEAIKAKSDYNVVERERLLLVLDELNLGTSMLVDEATRLKLGRMVGARLMVFGGYLVFAGQMRLDLRLVDVETGSVIKTAEKTVSATELTGWLKAAENAANELFIDRSNLK
jgi:curli biogenesis system outer membrane secretion channel CsgG